jgi:hypothetical protein
VLITAEGLRCLGRQGGEDLLALALALIGLGVVIVIVPSLVSGLTPPTM